MHRASTLFFVFFAALSCAADDKPLRVGWIGAMSGSVAKYGAYQAAQLAQDDINVRGGVAGRRFELVFQDGRCNTREAITAVNHLINVEKVRFIVGGHCSSETLPIALIADNSKTILLAAITSSPKLSSMGDHVFRVTAPNTAGAELLIEHSRERNFRRIGIVYEETEYAQGLAEYFKTEAEKQGIAVVSYDGFVTGETDLRSVVTKLKGARAEALYLSPQSPDGSAVVLRALQEQNAGIQVLGNEIAGNTVNSESAPASLFEGMVFAEPEFDSQAPAFLDFEKRYRERFNVPALPYGFYTCEAYDAVRVLAHVIERCGESTQKVKRCLYELSGYQGLTGTIGFDSNGDGVRRYILKRVNGGQVRLLEQG